MPRIRWIVAIMSVLALVMIGGGVAYKLVMPKRLVIVGPVLPDSPLGKKMSEALAAVVEVHATDTRHQEQQAGGCPDPC